MANYATLKAAIQQVIKTNGNEEITGALLQQSLLAMVNSLGDGYQYMGMATPTTNPGTPDQNVFYIASESGAYSNFGSLSVSDGEVAILKYNGTWTKEVMGVATAEQLTQLKNEVYGPNVTQNDVSPTGNAFVEYSTKVLLSNTNSRYYEFPNIGYKKVSAKVFANSNNYVAIAFYSTDTISSAGYMAESVRCAGTGTAETFNNVSVPDGCQLIVISNRSALGAAEFSLTGKGLKDDVAEAFNKCAEVDGKVTTINTVTIPAINAEIVNKTSKIYPDWKVAFELFTENGFVRPDGTESTNSSYRKSDYVDIETAITLISYGYFNSSIAPIAYYDSSKNFISAESTGTSGLQTITSPVPATAKYFKVSTTASYLQRYTLAARLPLQDAPEKAYRAFMSPSGNDANDGLTELTPVKSIQKVKTILREDGELVMLQGDYENLSAFRLNLFSRVTGYGNVRLIFYSQKITSAELATGYTRVYKAQYTGTSNISGTDRLYIHDLPDADTIILDAERHPLQKGRTHRVPSTMIYKAESIAEVESTTDKLCWYYSAPYIYFSLPANVDLSVNPLIVPYGYTIVSDNNAKATVELRNLNFLYTLLNLTGISGLLDQVSCGMGIKYNGQIVCDYCNSLLLRNCEAYCAHGANSTGDGVNVHNSDTSICESSKVVLENCWLHDNGDDGESSHENATSIHYGSLVEYNGNGITPATGAGTECHECIVRHSGQHKWSTDPTGTGFSAQGGVLSCFGCYSADNVTGYYASDENVAIAYNCIADGNTTDWVSKFRQINCTTL